MTVTTLRYNVGPTFDPQNMIRSLIPTLENKYTPNSTLIVSVSYDILLESTSSGSSSSNTSLPSYYIWRANSNQNTFDAPRETVLKLNPANIVRLASEAYPPLLAELNLFFQTSKVGINRILTVVFSFMPLV